GPRQSNSGPREAAVRHERVIPRASVNDRVAADDAIRNAVAGVGLAKIGEVRAESGIQHHAKIGRCIVAEIELLDGNHVRLEALQDVQTRRLVLLKIAGSQVRGHEADHVAGLRWQVGEAKEGEKNSAQTARKAKPISQLMDDYGYANAAWIASKESPGQSLWLLKSFKFSCQHTGLAVIILHCRQPIAAMKIFVN